MRLGKPNIRGAWLLPAVALLTACSGIPLKERQDAQRARYESYAGPPIDKLTYLGRYDSWQPIGTNELVVWTTINQAYLIKVAPPCDNLEFANRIGLTSTASTVSARFDFVKVGRWRCPIQEIRPVDYLRMKQDMRKETEEAKAAKSQNGS
jgi:Family of unknown function (DUF6491)